MGTGMGSMGTDLRLVCPQTWGLFPLDITGFLCGKGFFCPNISRGGQVVHLLFKYNRWHFLPVGRPAFVIYPAVIDDHRPSDNLTFSAEAYKYLGRFHTGWPRLN